MFHQSNDWYIDLCLSLSQANDYNVNISWEEEGEEALGSMGLTLLSTRMAHEAVSSYRAPSLQS